MLISHLVGIIVIAVSPSASADPCELELPLELRAAASQRYPGSALPKQADNDSQDIAYNRDHGGNGCLGVAAGSFTGLNRKDYGLLLIDHGNVWLVMASAHDGKWRFEKLMNMGPADTRGSLYVDKLEPGKYKDCCVDGQLERGQALTFSSDHEIVEAGRIESSGVAFLKTKRGWVHLWTSD